MAGDDAVNTRTLQDKVKILADLIDSVDTDYRGNLLALAGEQLRKQGQNYTGNILRSAGYDYGVNPKAEGFPG